MPLTTTHSVEDAIRSRHSVRAFLDKPVAPEQIRKLLDVARLAPSGVNMQPWQVSVVSGETKRKLEAAMLNQFQAGERGQMQYHYYPKEWVAPYKQRRIETGKRLYAALGIERQEKARQLAQWAANYRGFDAPVVLYFWIDDCLETGSYFDYGMFVENLMLLAVASGLATCPQGALGEYHEIVRETLGYTPDKILIGGMAIGYEDLDHPVNRFRTEREPVEGFTRFFD